MDTEYRTNLQYIGSRINLDRAFSDFQTYLEQNCTVIHRYLKEIDAHSNKYEHIIFHKTGITGHARATSRKIQPSLLQMKPQDVELSIAFLDITLFSDRTPTQDLEHRIEHIVKKYTI
ncbi:MAG: hypothetical protein ACMXYA_02175 [Candidatus Woesearchaeota archaeon]